MNESRMEHGQDYEGYEIKCSGCGDARGSNPLSCRVCQKEIGPEAYERILKEQTKKAKRFGLKPH